VKKGKVEKCDNFIIRQFDNGREQEWNVGKLEELENGRLENWNIGRLENRNPDSYRGEDWIFSKTDLSIILSFILPLSNCQIVKFSHHSIIPFFHSSILPSFQIKNYK